MLTTRVQLLHFFLSVCPLPCLFSLSHVLHPQPPTLDYQGACNMPGSMCQGSCSMLQTPHNPKMPKTCMTWTPNM